MSVNSEITTDNIIKNPDNWNGCQSNSPDKMIDGKDIVFEADHFLTYLLTNKHKPNVKPQGNNILPKTGIQNSIELIVISSGLALIGLWMMTKKYKDYNN